MEDAMRLSLALIALMSMPALAQQAPPAPAPAPPKPDMSPDSRGDGPFAAIKEVDPGLPRHVVYRPAALDALGGRKLGVVVWGNGGCAADGASARHHLAELASYGYVVIAPGEIRSGPGSAPAPRPPRAPAPVSGKLPQIQTTAEDVRGGIEWALAENGRAGSRYKGRIDPAMVAVGGHSCGGLQALQLAGDSRVRTVMVHNSGVFADGSNPITGLTVDKSLLETLHTPVLYVLGGPSDVAYPNGTDDVRRIGHVPVFLANVDVGHGGTFRTPNGGPVGKLSAAWLDWQLRGDAQAARTFTGADCRLCTDPQWKIERKRID
jgi:dienelactone hydrolase